MDKNQSGQALVLVLLGLAVVLTIVLFILSRSVTDISVSSSQGQAVSAFSAAEAGVEESLVVGSGGSSTIGGGASYVANVTDTARGATSFVYPVNLNSGDSITLWLKPQDASPNFTGNTIKVCWGKTGTSASSNTTPALEVTIYYETIANDPSTAKIFRTALDPYSVRASTGVSGAPANRFSSPGAGTCTISGQVFPFYSIIGLARLANPQFASIRMFYNTDTSYPVAFDSTNASVFPTQGITIDSSGTSGQSTRRVRVFQSWSEIPPIFQYAIFSPVAVTHYVSPK